MIIKKKDILQEAMNVPDWTPWPEDHYAKEIKRPELRDDEGDYFHFHFIMIQILS